MTGAPAVPGALNIPTLTGNEIVALASSGPRDAQSTVDAIAARAGKVGLPSIYLGQDEEDRPIYILLAIFSHDDPSELGEGSLYIDYANGDGKLGVVLNGVIKQVTTS